MIRRTAVVILNFNGLAFLKQFLPNVITFSQHDAEIIVADNDSTDDSLDYLINTFPQIRVIKNNQNYGFAGGYNKALEALDHDYFILLNSDVEVTSNWISPLIELFESDDLIAAVQPKLLDFNKRTYFEYAGGAGGFMDVFAYPLARGRIFDHCEIDNGQYDQVTEVFWASGACLAIRRDAFNLIQGFDPDLFAHMEEIDVCWRLKNRGFKIVCQPQSIVYHVGGGTLNKINPKKTFLNFRNNLIIITKNYHYDNFISVFLLRLCLDGLAGLLFISKGQFKHFWAVIQAHFAFYRNLFNNFEKRKKEAARIGTKKRPKEMLHLLLPYRFFIKKQKTFENLSV